MSIRAVDRINETSSPEISIGEQEVQKHINQISFTLFGRCTASYSLREISGKSGYLAAASGLSCQEALDDITWHEQKSKSLGYNGINLTQLTVCNYNLLLPWSKGCSSLKSEVSSSLAKRLLEAHLSKV